LRTAAGSVELKPGIDYVIIATDQVTDAPYDRLKAWIGHALEGSTDV
jgi:RNase P protein component